MLIRLALGTTDFDAYSEFIVHSGLPFLFSFRFIPWGVNLISLLYFLVLLLY